MLSDDVDDFTFQPKNPRPNHMGPYGLAGSHEIVTPQPVIRTSTLPPQSFQSRGIIAICSTKLLILDIDPCLESMAVPIVVIKDVFVIASDRLRMIS